MDKLGSATWFSRACHTAQRELRTCYMLSAANADVSVGSECAGMHSTVTSGAI